MRTVNRDLKKEKIDKHTAKKQKRTDSQFHTQTHLYTQNREISKQTAPQSHTCKNPNLQCRQPQSHTQHTHTHQTHKNGVTVVTHQQTSIHTQAEKENNQ